MSEREIFLAVLDLPATARTEYLDKACGADASLRNCVDALLNSHEGAGSFLGTPAVAPPNPESATTRTFGSEGGTGTDDEVPLGFLESPTRSDSLGRVGHYEVLQVLGQGGFGIVFRAFDEMLQRVVALKVLMPQLAATSPARKRFLREARSSAQVRHENVVQIHEVAEQPLPYLVMEFIPGETLQQKLDRVGPLDVSETLRIGRQIAEGLAAAHATDLIHRDIKPGNILLEGGQHKVKITDFGLARAADDASISQSGIIAGTPMYMAPEQALGQTLDQRADLFSLGSVLYQMVAGRPPFRANSTVAALKRVAEDTPRAIREIIPETPQWLCDIITKLHAKNPDYRYQSAREVADVLADCEAQLKANPKLKDYSRIPRGEQPSAPRPRFRSRWAAAVAVLVLLGVGIGFTEATGVTNVRGTVVRLFSPEGTLVVEIDDPGVSVKIDDSDVVITGAGVNEIRLKPGRYTVEARKDGKIVSRELVSVIRNGREVVRVSQEAPPEAKAATVTIQPANAAPEIKSEHASKSNEFFNGKDLTGWEGLGFYWSVKDGAIVGAFPPGERAHTFLCSKEKYRDFDLKFEVRRKDGVGNSGVQFRSQLTNRNGFTVIGPQCEIDSANWTWPPGSLVSEPNGLPLAVKSPQADIARRYKDDDFNAFHIRCVGKRVTIKVNGVTATDDLYPSLPDEGIIALQLHGGFGATKSPNEVTFRNIEFTDLSQTEGAAGFKALFNGNDLSGWVVESGDPKEWEVKNGEILGRSPDFRSQSFLLTERDYSDFVLRLEFALEWGTSAAVALRALPGQTVSLGNGGRIPYHPLLKLTDESRSPKEPTGAHNFLEDGQPVPTLIRPAVLKPIGEWNQLELEVRGEMLKASVNGQVVLDIKLDRSGKAMGAQFQGLFADKGRIGLQRHTGLIRYRRIEIKELRAAKK